MVPVFVLSFAFCASVNLIGMDLSSASNLFIIAGLGVADWVTGVLGRGGGAWVADVLAGIGGFGCAETWEGRVVPFGLATMPAPDVDALI